MNNLRIRVRFKGSCLKQDKVTFIPKNVVNLCISHELYRCSEGFFNWDSLHAKLSSHYKAWNYKNEAQKSQSIQELCLERTYS